MTAEHPEDWSPLRRRLVDALAEARQEAGTHNSEYAAGMRLACSMIESGTIGATDTPAEADG